MNMNDKTNYALSIIFSWILLCLCIGIYKEKSITYKEIVQYCPTTWYRVVLGIEENRVALRISGIENDYEASVFSIIKDPTEDVWSTLQVGTVDGGKFQDTIYIDNLTIGTN